MFEQDYIMRLIKEIIRTILKLLFDIDTDFPTSDLLQDVEERAALNDLLALVDAGKIDEAENELYEMVFEEDRNRLKMALLFYSHLNDKSDVFLEANDFSRDEIKDGLKSIASRYGLDSMVTAFLSDT